MKLSLVVTSPGPNEGKEIPVKLSQFLIGRDQQCHLRPASALISKRHCALIQKGEQVYLRDFGSTNGTFINDEPVSGEQEVHHEDSLKVGPLSFKVKLEKTAAINKPTPPPKSAAEGSSDDESVAAMLLALQDDGSGSGNAATGPDGVPQGSTVMEIMSPLASGSPDQTSADKPADSKGKKSKSGSGNTSTAAAAILQKYTRRQRG